MLSVMRKTGELQLFKRFFLSLRFDCWRRWTSSTVEYKVVLKDGSVEEKSENILDQIFFKAAAELQNKNEIDWESSMDIIKRTEQVLPEEKQTEENLIKIRASRPTASLASIVNGSATLQRLVDLGVNLHRWEVGGHMSMAVKLDFKEHVAPKIRFLADLGVHHDKDLLTRVAYLLSKKFTKSEIAHIIMECPSWLQFSVKGIDGRLGFLQKTFQLNGNQVQQVLNLAYGQ